MISFLNKLRFLFLKPDSRLELWLRTQYHRLMATRFVFKFQDWRARRSYQKWRKKQRPQEIEEKRAVITEGPIVTFLLVWDNLQRQACLNTFNSIMHLDSETWDLVLFAENKDFSTGIQQYIKKDQRIQLLDRTDRFDLSRINGEFFVICQPGDQLAELYLHYFYASLGDARSAVLVYYDCETLDADAGSYLPHFKPAGFSPELMLSVNYLSRGIIKRDAIEEILGEINPCQDLLVQEYDLNLKMIERKCRFHHIPRVLLTQAGLVTPNTLELREIIKMHLTRLGLSNVGYGERASGINFTWEVGSLTLTVVILTKNNKAISI